MPCKWWVLPNWQTINNVRLTRKPPTKPAGPAKTPVFTPCHAAAPGGVLNDSCPMPESISSFFQALFPARFDLLLLIYLLAITAEAMSGALAAGRRNMDIFGVSAIAFVTALGGGTIRDVVLGHYPVGWTQHPGYVYLVIVAGLGTTLVARFMQQMKKIFLMLDAMGLVAFSLIGCSVALSLDYPVIVVIMSGMLTGISGGILRDVLCNQVPVVFRR